MDDEAIVNAWNNFSVRNVITSSGLFDSAQIHCAQPALGHTRTDDDTNDDDHSLGSRPASLRLIDAGR